MIKYFNGYFLFPFLEKLSKRKIFQKLDDLKKFDSWTNDQQLAFQRNEMYKFLLYCQNEVPFYKKSFKENSFDPESIKKDIKNLQKLPVISKQIVRDNFPDLLMPTAKHPRKTGGSTGQSVFFYYDDQGLDWTSAINLYSYEMAGKMLHHTDCHIASEIGVKPDKFIHSAMDWLKLFSMNRSRLPFESFDDNDLKKSYRLLKMKRPYLLQGHPSSAYAIADYIERNNISREKLCSIFEPSGEMLTPKIVDSIEKNLGCKVVNRYGNAEFGVMAHSRKEDCYNKLQVFRRAFYIEEADKSNIIVSCYTNYGLPLLRYDTGDIATINEEDDGCFIYDIQGRVHDRVLINDQAYPTHFIMDYLDHKVRNIREFQILLTDNSAPQLLIVPENQDDYERIKNEILQKWPRGLTVESIDYKDLKRSGWRQKFRHVIDERTNK